MSEAELQNAVAALARLLGWKVAHYGAARTARGWRTPCRYDGKGLCDLLLVGHGRILFRELKADGGKLTVEQAAWIDRINANGGDAGCWRAAQWLSGEIERELRE